MMKKSIWERIFGRKSKEEPIEIKRHNTIHRKTISDNAKKTLGSGDLKKAVELPADESINEWLASNTVDFYNEISLLLCICAEDTARYNQPGLGFPPGFEYRWQVPGKKPIKVSGPEYVDYVMSWLGDQVDNPLIFPELESQPFPTDFEDYIKEMFKKMFRIYAIIYHRHFEAFEKAEAAAHLNTCFKHFYFFVLEFRLITDEKELSALKSIIAKLKREWEGINA